MFVIKSPTLTVPKPLPSVIDELLIVSTVPVEFLDGLRLSNLSTSVLAYVSVYMLRYDNALSLSSPNRSLSVTVLPKNVMR